ncbi:MAG: peptide chain release factor N(5)-glutamine methyltransferase [Polyangiales bacterium]
MSEWSVRKILDWMRKDLEAKGVDSPRLDAELMVSAAVGLGRMDLYLDPERPLSEDELSDIRARFRRRRGREPMAYILGYRDFYKSRFRVTPDVLIPRGDSELLVDVGLRCLAGADAAKVVDLCTGSGCVGISIAKERLEKGKQTELTLTDISPPALEVARENAKSLMVEVVCVLGDLFEALEEDARFDLMTINPPYIAEPELETLMPEVARFEPHLALVSGADGRDALRRILREAKTYLAPGGSLLVEVGMGQAPAFASALTKAGYATTRVHRDLGGIERMVEARVEAEAEEEETRVDVDEPGGPSDADFAGEQRVELDSPDFGGDDLGDGDNAADPEKSGE